MVVIYFQQSHTYVPYPQNISEMYLSCANWNLKEGGLHYTGTLFPNNNFDL